MGTYYLRDTAPSNVGSETAITTGELSASTGIPTNVTASLPALFNGQAFGFYTPEASPGATAWSVAAGSNTYTVQIDIQAAPASGTYSFSANRRTPTGGPVATVSLLPSGMSGTGLKSASGTGTLAGSDNADRFAVRSTAANSDMMSAANLTFQVNTVDSYVTVPWTVGGGGPAATSDPPPRRRAHMRALLAR